jgi:hypothetical protein
MRCDWDERWVEPVLSPADSLAKAELSKMKDGDLVMVRVHRARNPKHSAKFWTLVNTVWEATDIQDRYASPRALAKAIELALGHFDTIKLPDGTVGYDIHSLSFASMSQDDFSDFYSKAVEVVRTLVPHLKREDLERRVMELTND